MKSNYKIEILVLIFITVLFFILGCSEPDSPAGEEWISLGLKGKSVTSIKITKSFVYACASYSGLFRKPISSINDDWEYLGLEHHTLINGIDTTKGVNGPNTIGVIDAIINPNNENEILAGIITLKPNIPGIYKTTNGGINWFEADSGYGFNVPWWYIADSGRYTSVQVLFNPANQFDLVFAGDCWNDGIYRSTNSGLIWEVMEMPTLNDFSQVNSYFQDPINSNVIYAGGSSSPQDASVIRPAWLMKSEDYGESWHTLLPALPDNIYFNCVVHDICVTTNPHAIYLGMRGFVLGSIDDGKTWKKLFIDPDHPGGTFSVEASPKKETHLVAGNGEIFIESFDAGSTWVKLKTPVNGRIGGLKWDYNTDNLYVISSDSSGIYILPNASSTRF